MQTEGKDKDNVTEFETISGKQESVTIRRYEFSKEHEIIGGHCQIVKSGGLCYLNSETHTQGAAH
jgi:hypothetical protein